MKENLSRAKGINKENSCGLGGIKGFGMAWHRNSDSSTDGRNRDAVGFISDDETGISENKIGVIERNAGARKSTPNFTSPEITG